MLAQFCFLRLLLFFTISVFSFCHNISISKNARLVVLYLASYINLIIRDNSRLMQENASNCQLSRPTLCASYIEQALMGENPDFNDIKEKLRKSMHAMHFFDEKKLSHPEEDFDACMKIDSYDFVLRAQSYKQNLLELVKRGVPTKH